MLKRYKVYGYVGDELITDWTPYAEAADEIRRLRELLSLCGPYVYFAWDDTKDFSQEEKKVWDLMNLIGEEVLALTRTANKEPAKETEHE